MILQGSCSELVCNIPVSITDVVEVRKVLKEIENATKERVCLYFYLYDYTKVEKRLTLAIPVELRCVNIGKDEYGNNVIGVFYPMNLLPQRIKKILRKYEQLYASKYNEISRGVKNEFFPICLCPIQKILKRKKDISHIKISFKDGYTSKRGLKLKAEQHNIERNFPALTKTALNFKNSFTYSCDGGSTYGIKEWIKKHKHYYHYYDSFKEALERIE